MRFSKYVKDKINYILAFVVCILLIVSYLKAMVVNANIVWIVVLISSSFFGLGFLVDFWLKNRYFQMIEKNMDALQEKYLISEIMEKPRREENLAYFHILKRANKSMLENVVKARTAQKSYQEYIESWVHEIKIPITSVKLLCENHKLEVTQKIEDEMEEINNYVEQALFYARLRTSFE